VISGRTALYGVLGYPVAHSRSPAMQGAAFAALGIDAAYVALPVPPERLAEAVTGAHALGFQGLNVTVPHKQEALGLCATVDATARDVGAVNTLRRAAHGWEGFNTDAPACLALLEAAGLGRGARALLAGAGGAARAAAWALARAGVAIRVAARRPETARELAQAFGPATRSGVAIPQAVPWSDLGAEAAAADVVVNATSIGLGGHDETVAPSPPLARDPMIAAEPRSSSGPPGGPRQPHPAALALASILPRRGQIVVDFVYGETDLARRARAAGARLVTGEQLLVRQGALAFTLWTGRPAPEAVMSAAVARGAGSEP
jgi:shikimate dehydrogenase